MWSTQCMIIKAIHLGQSYYQIQFSSIRYCNDNILTNYMYEKGIKVQFDG